ncbi:tyrosine-type recombinase/integrase [Clostridium botulinum]|nr:site-specific integrase [Clostridium botulinum]
MQMINNRKINYNGVFNGIVIGDSNFTDDIWDLSSLFSKKTLDEGRMRINFSFIKFEDIKLTAKQYAYYKLSSMKPQSVRSRIGNLSAFIKYAEINGINCFSKLTSEYFLDYNLWLRNTYRIERNRNKGKRVSNQYGYSCSFIVEDIIRTGQIVGWNVPEEKLFIKFNSATLWLDRMKNNKKTKPISEEIYNKLLHYAVNEEVNILKKAEIIIQSQTGLRISEVLSIKEGCVKTTNDGYRYMEVEISKTEKGEPIIHRVFCNELVVNIINQLEEATKDLRCKSGLKDLFIFESPNHSYKILVLKSAESSKRLNDFIKKWDIRDKNGELVKIHSHQFRATFVRELIKRKIPMAFIMKHFNHVSIEMTSHYLSLQEEVKEIFADMILRPESKTAGLRAEEIKKTLNEQFKGKTEKEIDDIVLNLSKSMSFNPLPTGVCLYDFRRGNCSDGDGCFFYNCPNYITEVKFHPLLKKELELMESEMARFKELGRDRDWQRQYVKWKYLKPLVNSLEEQINEA